MRAYFFGNMYLSSIQQGIQSAHVLTNMFIRYETDSWKNTMLFKWANEHKTMILLNGGYSDNIRDLAAFFGEGADQNKYPWDIFNEGLDALDGALTCTGIILPPRIYEGAALTRNNTEGYQTALKYNKALNIDEVYCEYNDWEIELMGRLNKFGLAK